MAEDNNMNENKRPWDLWVFVVLTALLALGALGSDITGLDNIFWGVTFLAFAYLLYTTKPIARPVGIGLTVLNALYELAILIFTDETDSSLAIMMVIVAVIYIAYLQYRKDLFSE